jgi:hypothetical protein
MGIRRALTVAVAAVAISMLAAGPALAHFCYKTGWNEAAQAGASGSRAWVTAAEWHGFIDEAVAEGWVCEAGGEAAHAYVAAVPDDTLFMGPGLTAGGTLKNGKGKTPPHFGFVPVWEFEELCEGGGGHH